MPVGLDSDDDDDDDGDDDGDSDEDDDDDTAVAGQFRDILKRARLQQLRKEVAEDMGDDDNEGGGGDEEDDRQWAATRRYRYAGGDSEDEDEGDEDGGDVAATAMASTARLMREERDRLRRRMLGVGLQSDLPAVGEGIAAAAGSSVRPRRSGDSALVVRLASELPAFEPPPQGVTLERHLLSGEDRWPDMRRAFALKTRLEARLKPLAARGPEAALTQRQSALKWRYILACAYLRMRARGVPGLHRHPVLSLMRRAEEAADEDDRLSRPLKARKAAAAEVAAGNTAASVGQVAELSEPPAEAVAGHRPIYWEMQKNRPVQLHKRRRADKRRKVGDSNPRVKLRDKFRKALIKRRSQVPDVRTEVDRYSGEASGIRAGLVKSRKFK